VTALHLLKTCCRLGAQCAIQLLTSICRAGRLLAGDVKCRPRPEGTLRSALAASCQTSALAWLSSSRSGLIDRFRCDLTRPLSLSYCHRGLVEVDSRSSSSHRFTSTTTLATRGLPLHFFRFDYFGKRQFIPVRLTDSL